MKSRAILLSTIMVLFLGGPVRADEPFDVDARIQAMKMELKLTDDQVREIRPILTAYKDKIVRAGDEKEQRLRDVLSTNQMDKMRQMKKAIHGT